jgi:hypothetical protein
MFRRYVMVSWYSRALIGQDSWELMLHQTRLRHACTRHPLPLPIGTADATLISTEESSMLTRSRSQTILGVERISMSRKWKI